MNMRKIGGLILFLTGLCFLSVTNAQSGGPPDNMKTVDRIITMRNWKLMEKFDLAGPKAQKVFTALAKVDEKRAALIRKRRDVLRQLRVEVKKAGPDDKKLSKLISDYLAVMSELARIPEKEIDGLQDVFDVKDQARYLLFSEEFAREIKQLMLGRRHPPHRPVGPTGNKPKDVNLENR